VSRLSELAVSKRSATLLLAAGLFVAGIVSWGNLNQELLPEIDFPVVTVIAPYPGAGAADVAELVSKPIENAISGVPRLESIQSTSANSISLVVAQFSFGTDVKDAVAQIEDNIRRAGLPESVEPQTSAFNINASPVMIASIAATSADGLDTAADIARTEILPQVSSIEGVASADLTGGLETQVLITLDPDEAAAAGISVNQIVGVLQANNLTFPSGQLPSDGGKVPVSTTGAFTSVEQIRELVVGFSPPADGQGAPSEVVLEDVATVEEAEVATTGYARTDGEPSLTLTVTKTSTANTVSVADSVEVTLDEIADLHPDEIAVTVISDTSVFIEESRDGLVREGGLGALFAILTIFLFLFSLRSTLVAAISIPLSILTALVIMSITDISLNIMTLGGLAVAVGRVVDDAIVVLENIYRHRAMGESRATAVREGPREVAGAITASTLTTVAVFLPIGFVGGIVSQFFLPFALTVTFALLASLVIALTVVPVLAYLFIDKVKLAVDENGEPRNSFWIRAYVPTITLALRNGWTKFAALGISAALTVMAFSLVPLIPTQFINAGSEKILAVKVIPPAGASSETVLEQAILAEEIILEQPDVELVQTSVPGEGDIGFATLIAAFNGQPANSATITVRLDPEVDLAEQTVSLSEALEPVRTDGFDTAISEAAGFTSNNLNVIVSAEDPALVESASETVVDALSDNPDLINVSSDSVKASPEIRVTVDPNQAIAVGTTAAQVAGDIRVALVPTTATTMTIDETGRAEVVVRFPPDAVTTAEDVESILVGTAVRVPVGQVATVEEVEVQGSITRIDEQPAASITARITSEDTGAVSQDVQQEIDDLTASGEIPAGVSVTLAGVTEQQAEAFSGLFYSMAVAILLVYVMMVLTFNSLITPFIILLSLPLATVGAFPALVLTGRPIGISAMIGFLMLIGIVVTNAIVLLDLVERKRRAGMPTDQALIEGGRTRVRPILMTAIATILALIPLAAGFNEGSIIAAELGTVVIGGLFSSTFLTLIVVPVVYSLVDSLRRRANRRSALTPQPAAPEPAG
jgi:HAE1 family hydrophobic/amphiphilic exporter-1